MPLCGAGRGLGMGLFPRGEIQAEYMGWIYCL
jgi:hypothetical protein